MTKRETETITDLVRSKLPEYKMYSHSKHWDSSTDRAIITLVRHEVAPFCTRMNVFPGDPMKVQSVLSGRLEALRVKIPGARKPFILVNTWCPHSGTPNNIRKDFLSQMSTLHAKWAEEFDVIWMGDFNAALQDSQRKYTPTARIQEWDTAVRG